MQFEEIRLHFTISDVESLPTDLLHLHFLLDLMDSPVLRLKSLD